MTTDVYGCLGPELCVASAAHPQGTMQHIQQPTFAITAAVCAQNDQNLVGTIIGHPYWSDDELNHNAQRNTHADVLLSAFQRYDKDCVHYLKGAFAAVVLDPVQQRVFAAIDRLGQHSWYYSTVHNGLLFANRADKIRTHPKFDTRLSTQALFNYMYFHMVPSPGSIYQGLQKLPSAHYLDFNAGQLTIQRYWQPQFNESNRVTPEEFQDKLHTTILDAVSRTSDGAAAGAFLSGGLDSSTVSGMLARIHPDKAKTYSIGFDADGYDEMAFARIAAKHFQTQQHEYYVTPDDVTQSVQIIAENYDEPFGNSSAVPAYYCAQLAAQHGTARMLAGDGGDELFAGNERYAKQAVFERYFYLPTPLRGLLQIAVNNLPDALPKVRKAKSYIKQANIPLPDRLQTYNFLHRLGYEHMFSADFIQAVDPNQPINLQRDYYQQAGDNSSTLNRMLFLDWQFTLADNDIRKVNRMCALNHVDVVYPLLDDAVIDFSCQIPSKLKLKNQQLRYFYKQAMRGFLPEAIINKSKHGFGLPFGVWMRTHDPLRELAYDSLASLKNRHYFRPDFIDQAIQLHHSEHASYYGELIWIMMMLELWLQTHAD